MVDETEHITAEFLGCKPERALHLDRTVYFGIGEMGSPRSAIFRDDFVGQIATEEVYFWKAGERDLVAKPY